VIAASARTRHPGPGIRTRSRALVEAKICPLRFCAYDPDRMGAKLATRQPRAARQPFGNSDALVRTYSSALAAYRDQVIDFKPCAAKSDDAQVTGDRGQAPGAQAVSIDYEMEKTASGWKVYDVKISARASPHLPRHFRRGSPQPRHQGLMILSRARITKTTRGPRPSTLEKTASRPPNCKKE